MILRYEVEDTEDLQDFVDKRSSGLGKIFNSQRISRPTTFTSGLVTILVSTYAVLCVWMSLVISLAGSKIIDGNVAVLTLLVIPIMLIIFTILVIARQPKQSTEKLSFKVPFTPYFPALSIMINIYLMVELDIMTWIRFAVWIAVGLLIYFLYGRNYSKEKDRSSIASGKIN
jgi:L-asparagine transporter-like permease